MVNIDVNVDLEGNRKLGNCYSVVQDDINKVDVHKAIVQNISKDGIVDGSLDGMDAMVTFGIAAEKGIKEDYVNFGIPVYIVFEVFFIVLENYNFIGKNVKAVDYDLGNNENADSKKEDQKSYQTTKRTLTI